MAGQQIGCIAVDDSINVQAFIEKIKAEKLVVEEETVGDDGKKYIPIHKKA